MLRHRSEPPFGAGLPGERKGGKLAAAKEEAASNAAQSANRKRQANSAAHMFDEELQRRTASLVGGSLDWQLTMLSWACEKYQQTLPDQCIVRYEDIISSGGKALSAIVPAAQELDEPLESKNLSPLYDREDMLRIGDKLLQSEGAYWHYYSRESVEKLLEEIT